MGWNRRPATAHEGTVPEVVAVPWRPPMARLMAVTEAAHMQSLRQYPVHAPALPLALRRTRTVSCQRRNVGHAFRASAWTGATDATRGRAGERGRAAASAKTLQTPVAGTEASAGAEGAGSPVGLAAFLLSSGAPVDLVLVLGQLGVAVKRIAGAAARLGLQQSLQGVAQGGGRNESGDEQKALDVVADELVMSALRESRRVAVAASEESRDVVVLPTAPDAARTYCVCFDPLDGSRNIDAGIPTGTIFGVYPGDAAQGTQAALQKGERLLAAGYALYSSTTMLVLSLGSGVFGFTLDPALGEFLLTHPNMQMPPRGQIYSVNDGRYFDWSPGLRQYIDTVRQGKGQSGKKYSARYICSLVGDFHRTLMYGGVAMNPRSHLRLVYEANPLSFIAEQAGGKGWDGRQRVLELPPQELHQRLPLFLGSSQDIDEMALYPSVRQEVNPGYEV